MQYSHARRTNRAGSVFGCQRNSAPRRLEYSHSQVRVFLSTRPVLRPEACPMQRVAREVDRRNVGQRVTEVVACVRRVADVSSIVLCRFATGKNDGSTVSAPRGGGSLY